MSVRGATVLKSSPEPSSVITQLKASVDQPTLRSAAKKEPTEPTTDMDGRRDSPTTVWTCIHALGIFSWRKGHSQTANAHAARGRLMAS